MGRPPGENRRSEMVNRNSSMDSSERQEKTKKTTTTRWSDDDIGSYVEKHGRERPTTEDPGEDWKRPTACSG